ncbi:hypothetical protein E4582_12875 [Luteimonas yindakuii]|uniref:Uncharacterized protein n=1 Tax=Luteimonas yindakuii TaxID=2565782 RepID=A0A4Z1R0E6_9GAMM|nr:hypothetical protein [Luteimonas yindakuii]QCO66806.1 hypothetical protein E5843_01580 [Luteimonas yindakuii]TKS53084.1 hypothetical protein E4582_12875 [Luteimonas yindakuii]
MAMETATQAAPGRHQWIVCAALLVMGVVRVIDGIREEQGHHLLFGIGMLLMAVFATQHDLLDRRRPALRSMTRWRRASFLAGMAGVLLCLAAFAWRLAM